MEWEDGTLNPNFNRSLATPCIVYEIVGLILNTNVPDYSFPPFHLSSLCVVLTTYMRMYMRMYMRTNYRIISSR